ncbi:uncharacterized protein CBL_07083 [Carabus blaptoides fortunei]
MEKSSLGDSCKETSNNATGDCEKLKTPKNVTGDISEKKCKEYAEAVYELEYPPVFDIDVKQIKVDTCAVVVAPLVIGGENANPREFPHMALLGYKEKPNIEWKCGGTLISERFVLTAGHCLETAFGPLKWVRLGELNIKSNTDHSQPVDFSVEELIKHPEYLPPLSYNDIALVKLKGQVKFNRFIRPACLHTTTYINASRYIVTGWGDTAYGSRKGSDILQKVVLDSFSQDTCNATYGNNMSKRKLRNGILPETQMCAGGANAEKDTCQGDSGGPLQIYHKTVHCMYSIVGVTSFGKVCGFIGIPGIYTRVSAYIDWIEKTVWL